MSADKTKEERLVFEKSTNERIDGPYCKEEGDYTEVDLGLKLGLEERSECLLVLMIERVSGRRK